MSQAPVPADPPAPQPDPPRRARSHEAILETTYDLVVTRGYGKLTIEAIAAAAGVGKPTIYRWWPSKGALALDAMRNRLADSLEFPDTGDLTADLITQMTAVVEELTGDIGLVFRGIIAEAQTDPAVGEAIRATILEPYTAACEVRLTAAVEAGQLRGDVPPRRVVEYLYGPVYYRYLLETDALTVGCVPVIVREILEGLAPAR